MPHYCPVCAYLEWNLDELVEMIWEYLNLMRIYTKPKGKLKENSLYLIVIYLYFNSTNCNIIMYLLRISN